jgi:hypothetical protein
MEHQAIKDNATRQQAKIYAVPMRQAGHYRKAKSYD